MGVMFEKANTIYLLNWVPSQRARLPEGVASYLGGREMINMRGTGGKVISQDSFHFDFFQPVQVNVGGIVCPLNLLGHFQVKSGLVLHVRKYIL